MNLEKLTQEGKLKEAKKEGKKEGDFSFSCTTKLLKNLDLQKKHLGHSPTYPGIQISGLEWYFGECKQSFPDISNTAHHIHSTK